MLFNFFSFYWDVSYDLLSPVLLRFSMLIGQKTDKQQFILKNLKILILKTVGHITFCTFDSTIARVTFLFYMQD